MAADDRRGLEQLCRYITRTAISHERLSGNRVGQVVLKLKTAAQRSSDTFRILEKGRLKFLYVGTNENQIGRLRADLPKGQSMDKLTQAQLTRIQDKDNHTPRKCLGFLTPHEVAFNRPPRVAFRT